LFVSNVNLMFWGQK